MIKKVSMDVVSSKWLAKDTMELKLRNSYVSQHACPGQFLHIAVPGKTLRRPLSIASVHPNTAEVTVLFKIVGSGTAILSECEAGGKLDVLGPNGNGFPVHDVSNLSHVLLIGGGIGIPPLYFLANTLNQFGIKVTAILGFQQKEYVFYEQEFQQLANTLVVTDDGSYGKKGFVTDVLSDVDPFDRFYACGPLPMLRAVKGALAEEEGYLSFEERMGCGVGACYACVIPTNDGAAYKKICQQGPVFAASEVMI